MHLCVATRRRALKSCPPLSRVRQERASSSGLRLLHRYLPTGRRAGAACGGLTADSASDCPPAALERRPDGDTAFRR
jgi:hypothetical protein